MSKVTLRKKPIAKGKLSLFLDIYPPVPHPETGKVVRKHYLKLFVYSKPKTETERFHNKETYELANSWSASIQIEVQNKRFGFISSSKREGNFIDFFEEEKNKRIGSNLANWKSAVKYFKLFAGDFISFRQLNETLCEEYADFLKSKPALTKEDGKKGRAINTNAAVSYFSKFKFTLKRAFKKKLLAENIGEIIDSISPAETHREFLFQDELQRLADTPCEDDIKRASLVSALTGLRFSDIETLYWSEIRGNQGNYHIQFTQQKTRGAEVLPVSDIVLS
ncbi:integrase-like protein [Arcticibacter tournemirensis]|uniref:Site-specific integrase n=1 Tax=Arcticibacter tournemirensis TaxID=699437 RepID=A0A5M9HHT4_9SPHI|nr:site-specific integrase [Arcticibacter tournemirensis]KAA8484938.1 site-specific integrase [Arcticibacter tournemirensis]TQM50621.1 integrase-like protein [Arcticibacter tournemirensis]